MILLLLNYLSNIIRINAFYTNKYWNLLKNDATFTKYFPDKFLKYPPPKKYFWNVYSQAKEEDFKKMLNNTVKDVKLYKRSELEHTRLSSEAIEVFDKFIDGSIGLLCKLIS